MSPGEEAGVLGDLLQMTPEHLVPKSGHILGRGHLTVQELQVAFPPKLEDFLANSLRYFIHQIYFLAKYFNKVIHFHGQLWAVLTPLIEEATARQSGPCVL